MSSEDVIDQAAGEAEVNSRQPALTSNLPTSTPQSSPPAGTALEKEMAVDAACMPPPPRPASALDSVPPTAGKRSHDLVDSSHTVEANIAQLRQQGKQDQVNIDAAAATSAMPRDTQPELQPPPVGTSAHSQHTPPSAQPQPPPQRTVGPEKSSIKRHSGPKPSKPKPSTKGLQDESDSSNGSSQHDPQVRIDKFDWTDLEARYCAKIHDLTLDEQNIMEEFQDLTNFFHVWVDAGNSKDADRGIKRLKTQLTYVQHEEEDLEAKRQHYIKVVDAFKSALALLGR